MSNEILFSFKGGATAYAIVFNANGQVWRTDTTVFENWTDGNITDYAISCIQQGTSTFYEGNFPATIPLGDYSIVARQQLGGSAVVSDPVIAQGPFPWNGSTLAAISSLATSGQIGLLQPIRLARGTMIKNFPIYLVGSTDHVTPFTSGILSGQISRDGGSFGPLQSGAFTEIGLGSYSLQALTSGDLLANTALIVFNSVGISGGSSDNRVFSLILQRTSGQ